MEFCEECGSMMKTDGDMWVCGSCGAETPREAATENAMVTTEGQQEGEIVDLSDSEADARPSTEIQCVECDNDRAYWELKQIRAADESETRFFTCTECGHKWREDDH